MCIRLISSERKLSKSIEVRQLGQAVNTPLPPKKKPHEKQIRIKKKKKLRGYYLLNDKLKFFYIKKKTFTSIWT